MASDSVYVAWRIGAEMNVQTPTTATTASHRPTAWSTSRKSSTIPTAPRTRLTIPPATGNGSPVTAISPFTRNG